MVKTGRHIYLLDTLKGKVTANKHELSVQKTFLIPKNVNTAGLHFCAQKYECCRIKLKPCMNKQL